MCDLGVLTKHSELQIPQCKMREILLKPKDDYMDKQDIQRV